MTALTVDVDSNAWGICGSRGGNIPTECRRRGTEAVRDLSYPDVGIGQQRLGGLDVVVGKFRRAPSLAAKATGGGEARLGAIIKVDCYVDKVLL